MTAELLVVSSTSPDPAVLAHAGAVLRDGGLVAFPTETVYGLGANAFDEDAVARVFEAKGRPAHDPLIVHVHPSWPRTLVFHEPSPLLDALADRYWPGPLTLVAARASTIGDRVTANGPRVAARAPAHPVALALLEHAGVPIAAPSANRFGYVSPTEAGHVMDDLGEHCDIVLDGGRTTIGIESTVVAVEHDRLVVLRRGALTVEALRADFPDIEVVVADRVAAPEHAPEPGADALASPGLLERHYSPRARTVAVPRAVAAHLAAIDTAIGTAGTAGTVRGVVVSTSGRAGAPPGWRTVVVGDGSDASVAHELYDVLRAVDGDEPDAIVVELTGGDGLGAAIDDRLRRAASGVVALDLDQLSGWLRRR
jgi:L-threonylcarbamoyladenylate synthase